MWARMSKATLSYAVSDAEWAILAPLLAPVTRRGRRRRHDRRLVLGAVFDVRRGGLAWRLLPGPFPPWRGVDDPFRRWRQAGLWERINAALRERGDHRPPDRPDERGRRRARLRRRQKDQRPQAASCGRHAGPRPARPCPSGRRARSARRRGRARRPRSALAHGHLPVRRHGLPGPWPMARRAARLAIVKRPSRWVWAPVDQPPPTMPVGFQVPPKRWIVERTFAWLGRQRRPAKDWERLAATTETWIYLAMSRLMAKRLARAAA